MKIIESKYIPFKGFKAINLFGVIYTKDKSKLTERVLNHEAIHTAQMKELLYIFFYIWYVIEWIIRLFREGNAYYNIRFEREAYENEDNINYLSNRKPYAWMAINKSNKL